MTRRVDALLTAMAFITGACGGLMSSEGDGASSGLGGAGAGASKGGAGADNLARSGGVGVGSAGVSGGGTGAASSQGGGAGDAGGFAGAGAAGSSGGAGPEFEDCSVLGPDDTCCGGRRCRGLCWSGACRCNTLEGGCPAPLSCHINEVCRCKEGC